MSDDGSERHPTIECRLCGGSAVRRFVRRAQDDDEVGYFACTTCLALQTETPTWLPQIYAALAVGGDAAGLDTAAVERSILARNLAYFVCKLSGLVASAGKVLDWGGGPGLLTRLLRDVGIDAYNQDKYVRNHFAAGFEYSDAERYAVVTAFEVFEHFAQPATDLEPIFALRPRCLLIATGVFVGQGPDWAYLLAPKSEHVFFYSDEALRWIGRRFGYHTIRFPNDITLFVDAPLAPMRLFLLKVLFSNGRLAEILFALKRKWSLSAIDSGKIRARLRA